MGKDDGMITEAKGLIGQILEASKRLSLLTKRPFTPDGHFVGSIGEIYAQEFHGVELFPPSHKGHDGCWKGRQVQIKATQGESVDLKGVSDLLRVLKIHPDGSFEEIYNGDGEKPWQSLLQRKASRNGEISLSLNLLRKLNDAVDEKDRLIRKK
jgi:hypothetical protein